MSHHPRTFTRYDWFIPAGSVVLIAAFITWDCQSDWSKGAALLALYAIIATAFWWG